MSVGIYLNDLDGDYGYLSRREYDNEKSKIMNPTTMGKISKALLPKNYKEQISKAMTSVLYHDTYDNYPVNPDFYLTCFEQGAQFTTLDAKTLSKLLTIDDERLKPHIKNVLNAAIMEDASKQAYFDMFTENETAKSISESCPEIPYIEKDIPTADDFKAAQASTVIALFNEQYPYGEQYTPTEHMNPTVASYLREAIAEHGLNMERTFWTSLHSGHVDECNSIIAKDFLSICDQPNALVDAKAKDKDLEESFLKVCINSGMDPVHLTDVICGAHRNAYEYGTDFVDSIYQAGVKPRDLVKVSAGWNRIHDDDATITKHMLDNGADISDVFKTSVRPWYTTQEQFDVLWQANPDETNKGLLENTIHFGTTSDIDDLLTRIEEKGAVPNFSRAHSDETLMLRQDDHLYPYSEKLMTTLEKQGSLDEFKQEMLSFCLRHNRTDGIDNLIKKGAVLNDNTIKRMASDYSEGDSYTVSMAHIITAHNYKPTQAIKIFCAHDPEITKLFRNLETKDRIEQRLQPKEQIHRPVAKKRQGQTWKI